MPGADEPIDAPNALDRAAAEIERDIAVEAPAGGDGAAGEAGEAGAGDGGGAPDGEAGAAKPQGSQAAAPKAPEPKKGEEAGEPDFEAEAEKVIKPNAKAWRTFEGVKKKWGNERTQLQQKIKELEEKSKVTPADDAKIKEYEARVAEIDAERKKYQQTIAELDYSRSDEYQQKFTTRWEKTYKEGAAFAIRLKVVNAEGEPVRQATQADFESIRVLPPELRRSEAKRIFGDYAPDVLDYVRELDRIRSEADAAVEQHKSTFEKTKAERDRKSKEEQQAYGQMRSDAEREISTRFPEHFSPDHYKDRPELQKKLESGYSYVDDVLKNVGSMDVEDRAVFQASIRARAASFPLNVARIAKLEADLKAANEELAKFRQSDPGSLAGNRGAKTGDAGGGDQLPSSIDAAAAEFD